MAKLYFLFCLLAVIFNGVLTQDCSSPLVTGPCRAAFKVYGFDTKIGECRRFTYGGCQGNRNRYKTLEECKATCEDACNLPIVSGPCYGYFEVYGYDADLGECRKFIYGGCSGNRNRFNTLEECQDACECYY